MKINYRFILAGVLLACIAALGFSRGAWAGPLAQGTVPSCPTSGTLTMKGRITTCHASVIASFLPRGFSITATELDISSLGLPRHSKVPYGIQLSFFGPNNRSFPFLLVTVCFPDPTGRGVIYRYFPHADWRTYYNSNEPGRWVVVPTFNQANNLAGYTCTRTWLAGIYTIAY